MYKKFLITLVVLMSIVFSFSVCFANDAVDSVKNGVRDVVGGAENAVEGAAKDISNASKDATGAMENGANDIVNNIQNNENNDETKKDTNNNVGSDVTNSIYDAARTSTAVADSTFMGMNATAWTWLILGIAAIAIIALVWYYSSQIRSSNYDDRIE